MRILRSVLLGCAVLGGAAPAVGQDHRHATFSAAAGLHGPFTLYRGWITLDPPRDGGADPRVPLFRTHYTEDVQATAVASASAEWRWGSHLAGITGGHGFADTRAEYTGGAAPETFGRDLRWWGAHLFWGIALANSDRLSADVLAGPSLRRIQIRTGGLGRDALAHAVTGDSVDVRWSDRTLSAMGGLVGFRLAYRLSGKVAVRLEARGETLRMPTDRLVASDKADLRTATGRAASVRYERFTAVSSGLHLSLSYAPGLRERRPQWEIPLPQRLAAAPPGPRWSEALPEPVERLLTEGDTAAAVTHLQATASGTGSPALLGRLGFLLALTAGSEEGLSPVRDSARDLLERGLRGDPDNPLYLTGLGILLEKRGMWRDAERVLERAFAAAVARPEEADHQVLAEAFYRHARSLEMRVEEFRGLKFLGTASPPLTTPECESAGAFCLNWKRPRTFYDLFAAASDLDDLVSPRAAELMGDVQRSLFLDPTHAGAHRMLLRQNAKERDWSAFRSAAEAWAAADPGAPFARGALAAALHLTGETASADSIFLQTIPTLEPGDAAVFLDIGSILPSEAEEAFSRASDTGQEAFRASYWAAREPLFLTPANERRAEHHARVVLAELLFGEPQTDVRGWATDRGQILVRYGLPSAVWQTVRDESLVMSPEASAALRELLNDCIGGQAEGDCATMDTGFDRAQVSVGGRWIFWNYSPDQPSFIFEKELGRVRVEHMRRSISFAVAQELKRTRPTTYAPPFALLGEVPHQVARFRGRDTATWDVEVWSEVPERAFGRAAGDSLLHGFFLLPASSPSPLVERRTRKAAGDARQGYRLTLPVGTYAYSLEASTVDGDSVLRSRGRIGLEAPEEGLATSDLLLTAWVEPNASTVGSRRDLDMRPLRCVGVPTDGRFGVVFEIYGLSADDEGYASYQLEVHTDGPPSGNPLVRFLRGVGSLLGSSKEQGTLRFQRESPIAGDRVIEWMELDLSGSDRVERIGVTVTDARGAQARTSRVFEETCPTG